MPALTWPVLTRYTGTQLLHVALPLGGIGTGTISLGGRGQLRDFEPMNKPNKGYVPNNTFFALHVRQGRQTVTRALEGAIDPIQFEGHSGCAVQNHGFPRFRKAEFLGAYPLGQVVLSDPGVPVAVRLEAFNPFVPGDTEASGIPIAVLRYVLKNKTDKPLTATVAGSMENFIGCDGKGSRGDNNVNEYRTSASESKNGVRGIFMRSVGLDAKNEFNGTLSLGTTATSGVSYRLAWSPQGWGAGKIDFWDDLTDDGRLTDPPTPDSSHAGGTQANPTASLAVEVRIPPRATREVTFFISWHFPNRKTWTPMKQDETVPLGLPGQPDPNHIGNHYCVTYADAWDAAVRTAPRLAELEAATVKFVRAFCDADLPHVVKEAALYNTSTLRTQTCFRTADGRFYGWEGCADDVGCCHGSCTHVWNYEHASAFLFGALALDARETEFIFATNDHGLMSFRINLPLAKAQAWQLAAADGQMGTLMRLYREWQLSGDDAALRRLWPKARKAMEFCWIKGGWDADRDGVMEGCQHNTMDVEYYGPNPQMGTWYLGALRACEKMANYLGEHDFAAECRRLFESGRAWMDEHLFNGDYYEHEIRPSTKESDIAPGLRHESMGARNLVEPELQLGAGCLVDQLVGQYTAEVLGLGYLLDPKKIRKTLDSLMRFNFKRDLSAHFNSMRSYALQDEAAMLMASYPRGRRPARPFPYYGEAMTGFEYTAAVHMLYEGMTKQGLEVFKAVRDRHNGERRNPFNEPECGHHYSRAMASWAGVLAITGFHFSAVDRTMTFAASRKPVTWFWSTGYAWGTCAQRPIKGSTTVTLRVLHGELSLQKFTLTGGGEVEWPDNRIRAGQVKVFRLESRRRAT
ncbi:MAG: hypothetical protein IT444_13285 [Phycisphaeraceae bacterium]|nr:hypothetical protein [Phycisphaeraceae bacterium]